MTETTLPTGWVWTNFEDACEVILGQSPPSSTYNQDEIGLPFFQGKAEFGELYPTPVKWCSKPKKIAEAGDILISVRAPVGPTNLCREQSCIGRGLAAIRPKGEMGDLYFLYWLRYIEDDWDSKSTGTTFKAISGKILRCQEIPLPPLAEQHRIVAEIEKQLTRLDSGVAALHRAQTRLQRYKAAVLKAACEGRLVPQDPADEPAAVLLECILTERREQWNGKGKYKEPQPPDTDGLPELPEGWVWASLEQLSWNSGYGTSQKCDYGVPGPPVLRIPNIVGGHLDFSDMKYAINAEELTPEKAVAEGDLLIIRTNGSKDLIGRSALVRQVSEQPHFFASYLIRFRILNSTNMANWLATIWDAQSVRRQIEQMAATTAGQYNVNIAKLNRLVFPIPPLAEQQRIVAEVERRLSVVEEVEAALSANLRRAEGLRQSILKQAFEGRLVPQDPADEPASVLLARIRAAKDGGKARQLGLPGV